MKKLISLMLVTVMSLSLAACGNSGSPSADKGQSAASSQSADNSQSTNNSQSADNTPSVQMPNPFTEYASMDEAEKAAGFSLTVPETMEPYSGRTIRVMDGEDGFSMIEVIYRKETENGETDDDDEIRIRKAAGNEDISGDYIDYAEHSTVTIDNIPVSINGENGKIKLATWCRGDYTYSMGFYFDAGISSEDLEGFVASVQ